MIADLMPSDEDLLYEEELLRTPFALKMWLRYIQARVDAPAKRRYLLYERALRALPGSYKVRRAATQAALMLHVGHAREGMRPAARARCAGCSAPADPARRPQPRRGTLPRQQLPPASMQGRRHAGAGAAAACSSMQCARRHPHPRACRPPPAQLWAAYLKERRAATRGLRCDHPAVESLNNTYERALVSMHKMPRIWLDYLELLVEQQWVTKARRAFDRALAALPITQHDRVWVLYLVRRGGAGAWGAGRACAGGCGALPACMPACMHRKAGIRGCSGREQQAPGAHAGRMLAGA